MMRIVFAGTPDFALESLRHLVEAGLVPVAVLTQPDRPAGRGKKITSSPVKTYALEHSIEVLQPESLKDVEIQKKLKALNADFFVVAAYGQLLPQAVLDIPRVACINVHGSLLPRWRGAAPVQAAILAGDQQTGISLMHMEAGLDSGPVYMSSAITIGENATAGALLARLAELGGQELVLNLMPIAAGDCKPVMQDESLVTYAPKITTAGAELQWTATATMLERVIRAYNPQPGAWTTCGNERLKCWAALATQESSDSLPGTVVAADAAGIVVATGEGCLRMTELQRPAKKRVTARELVSQIDLSGMVLGARQ